MFPPKPTAPGLAIKLSCNGALDRRWVLGWGRLQLGSAGYKGRRMQIDMESSFAEGLIDEARRGDVLQQAHIKRALLERHGAHRAFALYKTLLALPDSFAIESRAILGLKDFAAGCGDAYFELETAGVPFTIDPPVVIGKGNHTTISSSSRASYIAYLPDARVRSGSSAIEMGDAILFDEESVDLDDPEDRLEHDPSIFARRGGEAWTIASKDNRGALDIDEAFTLLGCRSHSLGAWLWEYPTKLLAAASSGRMPKIPVLIDGSLPPDHVEALRALLPDWEMRELPAYAAARVRRLWCVSSLVHLAPLAETKGRFRWERLAVPPGRLAPIIANMNGRLDKNAEGGGGDERIFLTSRHHRPDLEDRNIVEPIAEARGFRIIDPEELDFQQQVTLLRGASFIVAPLGAPLLLTPLARRGTKLCILHHPHTAGVSLLTGLLREIGIDTTILTGDFVRYDASAPHLSGYRIDEQSFARFLNKWLSLS